MLPGALKGGTVLYPLGVEAVLPFVCPLSIPPGRQLHISEMVSKGIGR